MNVSVLLEKKDSIMVCESGKAKIYEGMDPRHYAPSGFLTYKFSNALKAQEFVDGWTSGGGQTVVSVLKSYDELFNKPIDTFVVYASPIIGFQGERD